MIKKENTNIEKVFKSSDEIAKVYLGTNLIFENDKPLWIAASDEDGIYYSLDGINYTKLVSDTKIRKECTYFKGKFYFSYNDEAKLQVSNKKDLIKGNYIENVITLKHKRNNPIWSINSTDNWMVTCLNYEYDFINYTTDGIIFNQTNMGGQTHNFVKLDNDRFFLGHYTNAQNGTIYYIKASNPNSTYSQIYKDVDGNQLTTTIDNATLVNGKYIISSGRRIYSGNNISKADNPYFSITTVISNEYLGDIVYCYNKYFGIIKSRQDAYLSNYLFYSDDAITWKYINVQVGYLSNLYSFNDKLYFTTSNRVGVINDDFTFNYTSIKNANLAFNKRK